MINANSFLIIQPIHTHLRIHENNNFFNFTVKNYTFGHNSEMKKNTELQHFFLQI